MRGGTKKPILIVEDNADVRGVFVNVLEQDGYAVVSADNGKDALAQLEAGLSPSLILLDCHMPVMDGRAFRVRQLEDDLQVEVPVLLFSADPAIRADDLHVEAVLRKPVDLIDLLVRVEHYCGRPDPNSFDPSAH